MNCGCAVGDDSLFSNSGAGGGWAHMRWAATWKRWIDNLNNHLKVPVWQRHTVNLKPPVCVCAHTRTPPHDSIYSKVHWDHVRQVGTSSRMPIPELSWIFSVVSWWMWNFSEGYSLESTNTICHRENLHNYWCKGLDSPFLVIYAWSF